ncbi:hypothetical protein F4804DRAFT_328090 [Jackrogersella minutella]|nr:hypothetical protein F4804DRAFT_328090 [Jackrogersella minutella]
MVKPEINAKDNSGRTPLSLSCLCGHVEVSSILLESGADTQITDMSGHTPLHDASVSGYTTIVKLLLGANKFNINQVDLYGWTPLISAAFGGHEEVVRCLVGEGADINKPVERGYTALMVITMQGSEKMVRVLLDLGAEVNTSTNEGLTALHYACHGNDTKPDVAYGTITHLLLEKKANPGAVTTRGETALHVAARHEDSRRLQMIMNHIEDIQIYVAQNAEHRTALSVASQKQNLDTMRYLLNRMSYADFGRSDFEEEALLLAAKSADTHDIATLILMKSKKFADEPKPEGSESWSSIEWAVHREMPSVLSSLLSSSPLTPDLDERRKRALDMVSSPSNQSIVKNIIRDILWDPPFAQTSRPREPFQIPKINDVSAAAIQDFEAAVIQFYASGDESGFLRRFPSVEQVVYDEGPGKIIQYAKSNLRRILGEKSSEHDDSLKKAYALHEMFIESDPKFTWIHLPATNLTWMNDLLKRMMKEDQTCHEDKFHEINSFFRGSWFEIPDRTSESRIMKPQCVTQDGTGHRMAIYMPYLTFSRDTHVGQGQEDNMLRNSEQAKKKYEDLFDSSKGQVVHGSPTLDEFYYHSASRRNEIQAITEMLHPEKRALSRTLLRVNQLWIWVIDNKHLITSTTHPVDKTEDSLLLNILDYISRRAEVGGRHSQPSSAVEMSKLLVDYCVGFYEREHEQERADQTNRSIRQIFSNAINKNAIKEADLYESFRLQKSAAKEETEGWPEGRSSKEIKEAIRETVMLSCDIKDTRDELNMLKTIAGHQKNVQDRLNEVLATRLEMAVPGESGLSAAYIVDDIAGMDEAADRIRATVDTILAFEQNEMAGFKAAEGMRQVRTLLVVFIAATIFLLPLSFISYLFIQRTPSWVFAVIFAVSFAVFGPIHAVLPADGGSGEDGEESESKSVVVDAVG